MTLARPPPTQFLMELYEYSVPMIPEVNPHGTGCTFSAAIASHLALGSSLPEAVAQGKKFITRAIEQRHQIGGYELLNQLPAAHV